MLMDGYVRVFHPSRMDWIEGSAAGVVAGAAGVVVATVALALYVDTIK